MTAVQRNLRFAAAFALVATGTYVLRRWGRDKPRPDERERIGYPPLDTPKAVSENIWIVDSGPLRPAGLVVPIRMTLVRLAGGELLLHSPTQLTDSLAAELEQLGPVRHLVAPTIGHWTFLAEWQSAFPEAEVWAVPGLGQRPQVRSSGLRIDHELGGEAPEAWTEEIEQGLVKGGGGFNEAYFFHQPTRSLVLADLVQNLDPGKLPPATALAAKLARSTSGRTPAHVRMAILLGGARAKDEIRQLVQLQPDKVIFAHGNWFTTRAAERLSQAFEWLL